MPIINQIQIDGVTYDIEDANTKQALEELEEQMEVATVQEYMNALYS